jgi:GntP family gluconate:H+ symporter
VLAHFVDRWVPKFADAGTAPEARVPAMAASGAGGSSSARLGPDAPGNEDAVGTGTGTGVASGGRGAAYDELEAPLAPGRRRVSFAAAIVGITLPVVLMLIDAIAKLLVTDKENGARKVIDFFGTPTVALLISVLFCYIVLGLGSGMTKEEVSGSVGASLPPIAGIILIVAAGGGFKQTLIDAGVGNVIKDWATGVNISVLVLGWLVAVLIRLGTGSATVATITAAGIVGPLAGTLSTSHLALLVLAIGCGSLFFSHVNDAGFWLVKEYFGLTVGETIKSWSVMETVISVVGFVLVMALSLVV